MPRDLFDDTDDPMASEKDNFSAQTHLRQHLIRVALGRAPADLVIRGGRLVNAVSYTHLDVYKRQVPIHRLF